MNAALRREGVLMRFKTLLIATSLVGLTGGSLAFAADATKTNGPDTGGRYQTGTGDSGNLNSGPDKTPAAREIQSETRAPMRADQPMNAHPSMTSVRGAQATLKQQGLYKGQVDGKIGPQTRSALTQFQAQNGLSQTARLDQPTIDKLTSGASMPQTRASQPGSMPQQSSAPGTSGSPSTGSDRTMPH
jgi:hypothetical protein